MNDRITIRPATPEDEALLFALFAEEKAAELAPLGLPAMQLQPLLEMQYRGRELSYTQAAVNPASSILCAADGASTGRMLVDRQPECIRVMDIAVLAAYRNRGMATEALRRLQAEAAGASLPLRLRVMKNSAAERLYRRVGFEVVGGDEPSHEMQWLPETLSKEALNKWRKALPQRLKPLIFWDFTTRLKPCPFKKHLIQNFPNLPSDFAGYATQAHV